MPFTMKLEIIIYENMFNDMGQFTVEKKWNQLLKGAIAQAQRKQNLGKPNDC